MAYAATLTVNSLADTQVNDNQCTLREAIIIANNDNQSGSTDCATGSSVDTINFNLDGIILLNSALPTITQDIIIDGVGQTIHIDGQNTVPIFNITAAYATFQNLTIQNGSSSGEGGGINAAEALTLSNVVVVNNVTVSNGGGVAAGGPLIMANSQFENNSCNTAGCDGGGAYVVNNATITNTNFFSNTAVDRGGSVASDSTITIIGGQLERNQAGQGGGLFADKRFDYKRN